MSLSIGLLPIGTRVMIKKSSRYFEGQGGFGVGTITRHNDNDGVHIYQVAFVSYENCYRVEDLEAIEIRGDKIKPRSVKKCLKIIKANNKQRELANIAIKHIKYVERDQITEGIVMSLAKSSDTFKQELLMLSYY